MLYFLALSPTLIKKILKCRRQRKKKFADKKWNKWPQTKKLIYFLVPKSSTHTGLDCVKTRRRITQAWAPLTSIDRRKNCRRKRDRQRLNGKRENADLWCWFVEDVHDELEELPVLHPHLVTVLHCLLLQGGRLGAVRRSLRRARSWLYHALPTESKIMVTMHCLRRARSWLPCTAYGEQDHGYHALPTESMILSCSDF